jgi:hypothetical protein
MIRHWRGATTLNRAIGARSSRRRVPHPEARFGDLLDAPRRDRVGITSTTHCGLQCDMAVIVTAAGEAFATAVMELSPAPPQPPAMTISTTSGRKGPGVNSFRTSSKRQLGTGISLDFLGRLQCTLAPS